MPTHIPFNPNHPSLAHVVQQGNGMPAFVGLPYQRGHGIGSFFSGLFRTILPVAKNLGKSALKAVGKEALRTGVDVANDALAGQNIKQSLQKQSKAASRRLAKRASKKLSKMQQGSGMGKRPAPSIAVVPFKRMHYSKKRKHKRTAAKRSSVSRTFVTDALGSYYA